MTYNKFMVYTWLGVALAHLIIQAPISWWVGAIMSITIAIDHIEKIRLERGCSHKTD